MNQPEGLTVAQAASQLGVSEITVRRLIKKGKLPAYKVGSALRVTRAAVEAIVAGGKR